MMVSLLLVSRLTSVMMREVSSEDMPLSHVPKAMPHSPVTDACIMLLLETRGLSRHYDNDEDCMTVAVLSSVCPSHLTQLGLSD